ncbi:MAG: hypothetical protein HY553_18790 [Elusimicrobia bacterium]|nr:hypothetical protein [Elusimicrobiota bacterium]
MNFLSSLLLAACAAAAPAPVWEVREGLSAPESALVVPSKGWVLVSNVAGTPHEKDGNGWISKLSLEGKVLDLKWAIGLDAPKGMKVSGGKLYVADVDQLVEIRLESGKILRKHRASDAKLLNDVALDAAGRVYVSDTMGGRVYRLEKAGLVAFLEGDALESPNGLAIRGDALYVAGWGPGIGPDWSSKAPGRLLSFGLKTKTRREHSQPLGNLDGLEWAGDHWLVSDWVAGKVYRVDGNGAAELLLEGLKGAADIGFDRKTRLLIVPRMNENAVSAYKL